VGSSRTVVQDVPDVATTRLRFGVSAHGPGSSSSPAGSGSPIIASCVPAQPEPHDLDPIRDRAAGPVDLPSHRVPDQGRGLTSRRRHRSFVGRRPTNLGGLRIPEERRHHASPPATPRSPDPAVRESRSSRPPGERRTKVALAPARDSCALGGEIVRPASSAELCALAPWAAATCAAARTPTRTRRAPPSSARPRTPRQEPATTHRRALLSVGRARSERAPLPAAQVGTLRAASRPARAARVTGTPRAPRRN